MKKLLLVLGFVLAAFSFQASASALQWDTVPVVGPGETVIDTGSGTDALLGIGLFANVGGNINHTWNFKVLNSTTPVKVELTDIPDGWLSSATFLFAGHDLLANAWTGLLNAGVYSINVAGLVGASLESYSLRVNVAPAAVPVPAAIWLFGSAFLGLMGIVRRKKT